MAITQIHTHRRNRLGSWRDGEGGALDSPRPSDAGLDGGADAAAPAESSKSDYQPTWSHPTAGLRIAALEDGSLPTPALAAGSQRRRSCLACRQRMPSRHCSHAAKTPVK